MPRNVRPSWIRLSVDGRASTFTAGPRARSGRMSASFDVREDGGIVTDAVNVAFLPSADGSTTTVRVTVRGKIVHEEKVAQ